MCPQCSFGLYGTISVRMRDFLWHLVHSIIITRRVKMGDLPDFTKLLKSPERLQLKCIIKITNSIIVMDLAHKYDVHAVILHETRNDIFIDKLEVECPGNRFEECTGWENFHISCYVSRAFQILCDEVLCGMNWANPTQIEEIRGLVEKKFKVRLLSVVDEVNTTKDNVEVCRRFHNEDRKSPCLECIWHNMIEKYFKKRLEMELLYLDYWLGGLYAKPMKGYSRNMTNIYRAVQDLEHEECEKDIRQTNKERAAFYREKRQMNQQFETSKRQKTENNVV